MNVSPPTLICGYCGVARPASHPCTCAGVRQVQACRQDELTGLLAAQRAGVASLDTRTLSRARWLSGGGER